MRDSDNKNGDGQEIRKAIKGKRVYFIWDEMPTALKNRSTIVYRGVRDCINSSREAYQTMLSATPLENEPEDVYNCVKLLDSNLLGTVGDFRKQYALSMNPFARNKVATWNAAKLPELGMRLTHITHQADKYRDPDIAAQFPKEQWEDVIIDMSSQDKKLYDSIINDIQKDWQTDDLFSQLLVLQLICDNPALINYSNAKLALEIQAKKPPTDAHSAKLNTLKELLHSIDGKIVVFNMYDELGAKPLFNYINKWGYNAVLYDGNMTKKQEAEDRFRNDDDVKIFVSSDKGSDSINLEKGMSVINYNYPWKWTTLIQRVNRINRLTSEHDHIYYYNLLVADSIEDRKAQVISRKKNLQESIFSGAIAEQSEALEDLSQKDLWYMLTGE
jgi:hypothetical protein